MIKFSIIIPIYKESTYTLKLLEKLESRDDVEIIIELDEPEERFLSELKNLLETKRFNYIIRVSKSRRGKVTSLNDAIQISRGKYIIFLDADVYDLNLDFDKLETKLRNVHLIPFFQEYEEKTLLQKLVSFEGVILNLFYLLARRLGLKAILINGAAFAVRKEVFNYVKFRKVTVEDLVFSAEVFLKKFRYDVDPSFRAYVAQVRDIKQFIDQRVRWGVNTYEVLSLDLFRKLVAYEPKLLLMLLLYWPSLLVPMAIVFLINLSFTGTYNNLFSLTVSGFHFNVYGYILGLYVILVLLVAVLSKKFSKKPMSLLTPIFYLVFIQPVIIAIYIGVVLLKALFKANLKINWKV